jgi:hypothetical protein
MGAPKDNKFWMLRSKHGRDTIFATPQTMKEACYEYFEYQSEQSWERVDFKGKEVEEVKIPTSSPFTLTGLCIFLDVNTDYFNQFESNLKGKTDKKSKDFSGVITHIRDIIYSQKFEGAAVGAYNANIIARDLGIVDKQELDIKGVLSEEDREKRIKALEQKMKDS